MSKPIQKAAQPVFNDFPTYQSVCLITQPDLARNQDIFYQQCYQRGDSKEFSTVFFLVGPGTVTLDLGLYEGIYFRKEIAGGKNAFTRNELDKQAIDFYNEMFAFLVSAHSWVFSFAE